MLNRSEILTAAWKAYRLVRPAFFAAGDTATHRKFLRGLFGKMLRKAWAEAKTAAAFVAAQARVMVQKVATLPAGDRSVRIVEIRQELQMLDYAPWGIRTSDRRMDLNAQLAALCHA